MSDRILFHQRIIPHYQFSLCVNLLEKNKNIIFVYGNPKKGESLINAGILPSDNFRLVKNYYIGKNSSTFFAPLYKIVKQIKPKLIISQGNIGNLTLLLFLFLRPFLKYKLILWSHGWDRRNKFDPDNSFYDKYRLSLQKKADALILYSQSAKKVLADYINEKKIFVAPNTIDTNQLKNIKQKIELQERKVLKSKLGMEKKYNIIFSARLEENKNPMKLLYVFEKLQNINTDVGLNIIGDGTLFDKVKLYISDRNLDGVKLHGAIYDFEKTGEMIYCSDLMIIPQALGLSVIHSFCFSCPVVVLDDKYNGPEIDYISNNVNGFLLYGLEDDEIVKRINSYLMNEQLNKLMRSECINTVGNEASVEIFIKKFIEAINETIAFS